MVIRQLTDFARENKDLCALLDNMESHVSSLRLALQKSMASKPTARKKAKARLDGSLLTC